MCKTQIRSSGVILSVKYRHTPFERSESVLWNKFFTDQYQNHFFVREFLGTQHFTRIFPMFAFSKVPILNLRLLYSGTQYTVSGGSMHCFSTCACCVWPKVVCQVDRRANGPTLDSKTKTHAGGGVSVNMFWSLWKRELTHVWWKDDRWSQKDK